MTNTKIGLFIQVFRIIYTLHIHNYSCHTIYFFFFFPSVSFVQFYVIIAYFSKWASRVQRSRNIVNTHSHSFITHIFILVASISLNGIENKSYFTACPYAEIATFLITVPASGFNVTGTSRPDDIV